MVNNKANDKAKLKCVVAYDVITRCDSVHHKVETIMAATKKSLFTHLRMKNKGFGLVRNVCILSETLVA